MFGVLLAALSSALGELSDSIGKQAVRTKISSIYTFGFLTAFAMTVVIITIGIFRHDFIFSLASLPTFIPRLLLEIAQTQISIMAIVKADRSDFGLIRTLTVPLLLIVDINLGYHVTAFQVFGIGCIVFAIAWLFYAEHSNAKGRWLIIASALNAVITISLYKYDISHFNSVEAEQSIISLVLMLYFFIRATQEKRENPVQFFRHPILLVQAMATGLSSAAGSYAIVFAPASVVTAALRASAVLFSLLSGKFYFQEKKFTLKIEIFCVIAVGLLCLLLTR